MSSDEKCIQHSYYRAPCLVPRAKWLRMSTRPLGRRHPHQWYCAVRRPHRLHNLRTHVQKRLYTCFFPSRLSPELSRFGFLLQAACTCHFMLRHDPFQCAATVRTHQHAHNRRDDIRPILLIWSFLHCSRSAAKPSQSPLPPTPADIRLPLRCCQKLPCWARTRGSNLLQSGNEMKKIDCKTV
jgi:hypothetical protein